jgi:hypothetical protein
VFGYSQGGQAAAFGLVIGAATGLAAAYPDVPFAEILHDRGRELVERVKQACVVELGAAAPFAELQNFVTIADPLAEPRWQARLTENKAGQQRPGAPMFLYHATFDELIPFRAGKELLGRYCDLDATVQWQPIPLAEHIIGVSVGGPIAMDWLGTRFAGTPAQNTRAV